MMTTRSLFPVTTTLALIVSTSAHAQDKPAANNGIDPTRFQTVALAKYEYLDLWELTSPVTAVDAFGLSRSSAWGEECGYWHYY